MSDILNALATMGAYLRRTFAPRATISYPEERPRIPPRWRGRIVLTRDPEGAERCVACYLCAVACPVDCIALQATEDADGRRYPAFFRINFARCIFCGYCEEACPVSAIFMGKDYELAVYSKDDFIWDKSDLLVAPPAGAQPPAVQR